MTGEIPVSRFTEQRAESLRHRARRKGVEVYDETPDGWLSYTDDGFASTAPLVNVFRMNKPELDQMNSIFGKRGWGLKLLAMDGKGYHNSIAEVVHAPTQNNNYVDSTEQQSSSESDNTEVVSDTETITRSEKIEGGFGRRTLTLYYGTRVSED